MKKFWDDRALEQFNKNYEAFKKKYLIAWIIINSLSVATFIYTYMKLSSIAYDDQLFELFLMLGFVIAVVLTVFLNIPFFKINKNIGYANYPKHIDPIPSRVKQYRRVGGNSFGDPSPVITIALCGASYFVYFSIGSIPTIGTIVLIIVVLGLIILSYYFFPYYLLKQLKKVMLRTGTKFEEPER